MLRGTIAYLIDIEELPLIEYGRHMGTLKETNISLNRAPLLIPLESISIYERCQYYIVPLLNLYKHAIPII